MIRGKTRQVNCASVGTPEISANIHNRFDIEVIDSKTGEVKQKAYAENIILDTLWTKFGSIYFVNIHYGTGTGTPNATRATLFSFLGTATASEETSGIDLTTGVYFLKKKIALAETTAVGSSLTEVGVAFEAAPTALLTHAMLKDMNGNQISILKTNTDIINIYATIFVHFNPAGYSNGSIKIVSGSLLKAITGGAYFENSAVLEFGKGSGFDYGAGNTMVCYPSNISASKQIKATATRLAVGSGNTSGGFGRIVFSGISFLVDSDGWFAGSTITGEAIGTGDGVTTNFNFDFTYAENATIYIDGVAQGSGVATRALPNLIDEHFGSEFNAINSDGTERYAPKPTTNLYGTSWQTTPLFYENPHYLTIGMLSYYMPYSGVQCWASNDLINWVIISDGTSGEISVPIAYRNYRYWKTTFASTYSNEGGIYIVKPTAVPYGITFDTPPASGAVITADYTARCIAKDANHVFDFNFTIQLGEKTA